ncbi:MAG: hypothetical protein MAG451_01969 [Anaerolineales bacterium]|nr:hypothetical protein [Anaerolineales bacterium]
MNVHILGVTLPPGWRIVVGFVQRCVELGVTDTQIVRIGRVLAVVEPLQDVVVVPPIAAQDELCFAPLQCVDIGRVIHELDVGFDAHVAQHVLRHLSQALVLVLLVGPVADLEPGTRLDTLHIFGDEDTIIAWHPADLGQQGFGLFQIVVVSNSRHALVAA